jgi:hypothetical protein
MRKDISTIDNKYKDLGEIIESTSPTYHGLMSSQDPIQKVPDALSQSNFATECMSNVVKQLK